MKKHGIALLIVALTLGFLMAQGSRAFGEQEIDLGDTGSSPATTTASQPTPAVIEKPVSIVGPAPTAKPTGASQDQDIEIDNNAQPATQAAPTAVPTVYEVHGMVKMKDFYDAGKTAYQEQEYDRAIRYWTKAVRMKDHTPKLYYAEAYAMMGVIYQYHIIHYGRAYRCYAEALKYEHNNQTARRHIRQVYKYRHRKD